METTNLGKRYLGLRLVSSVSQRLWRYPLPAYSPPKKEALATQLKFCVCCSLYRTSQESTRHRMSEDELVEYAR